LLDKAPDGTLPTNAGAVVISTPQADRDYYRIGVGIDFVDLVKMIQVNRAAAKAKDEAAKKAAETAATTPGTGK
jgi:hypothetical protein